MSSTAPSWSLVPRFLLRRAGFGFAMLGAVSDGAVDEAARRFREAVSRLEERRRRLLDDLVPRAVRDRRACDDGGSLRWLSAVRRSVGRRKPVPAQPAQPGCPDVVREAVADYDAAWTAMAAARDRLAAAVRDEQGRRRDRLRGAITPEVRDAVLQLAPSFADRLSRWSRDERPEGTARERAMHRRVYLYCQRLAAKNETTSFFGPLTHGRVEGGGAGMELGPELPGGVRETRGFASFWAVCALARRAAGDPTVRSRVPITRVSASRLAGDRLVLATGREVRLAELTARVAGAIDGVRSAEAIERATGLDPACVAEAVGRLERLGAARAWPEPASTDLDPLGHLTDDLRRWAPACPWPDRLAALHDCVDGFRAASGHEERGAALSRLEREFEELAGVPARREGGRMYADRLVAYLDAQGDLTPVRMGAGLAGAIERALAPVLDVAARYGELVHEAHRDLATEVLRDGRTTSMPYDEFARRLGSAVDRGALTDRLGPAGRLRDRLIEAVRERLDGTRAALEPDVLRAVGGPDGRPRFVSPDLLLRERDGELTFVLGELHPYVFAWGSQGQFCDDPAGLRAAFEADLSPWGGRDAIATVVRRRRHKGLVSEWFPGLFIEVTAVAARDRSRCVPVTDLAVVVDGGRPRLCHAGRELVLYAGEDDHPHLLAFAPPPVQLPPVRIGDLGPRIEVGPLVAQRARWWLRPERILGAGGARGLSEPVVFERVQRERATSGLPRWVYAHVAGEPKPVCLDLDSPLAVEALAALLASGPDRPASLTEMLPEPDGLWLRRAGCRATSELRLALIRGHT